MRRRSARIRAWLGALLLAGLLAGACSAEQPPQPVREAPDGMRIAAIFSGPVDDGDYNQLGLAALRHVGRDGVDFAYTDNVAPPEAERILRDYVADGYGILWAHGGQYYAAAVKVAREFGDVAVIAEADDLPGDLPPNVTVIDRMFQVGFYVVGVLAAELSRTGVVGYVGGLPLPFSNAEVHALRQAIADRGADVTVLPVWTLDFNDVDRARQIAGQLITEGADVLVSSLNDGTVGVFQSAWARSSGGENIHVIAKYTDKSRLDLGGNYAGTVRYDFTVPLAEILDRIAAGIRSGHYPLGFDTGVAIDLPPSVPASVAADIDETVAAIVAGDITVDVDTSPVGR